MKFRCVVFMGIYKKGRTMYQDRVVLCASNAYERKYYINPDFSALPSAIQDELKVMSVLFTEEVGGVLSLIFEEDGSLSFEVAANEEDLLFDEIGSALKVKQLQQTKQELLEALEMYYRVFFLGEDIVEEE